MSRELGPRNPPMESDEDQRPKTILRWERIGQSYQRKDLDVTDHVDMGGLSSRINLFLQDLLPMPFTARIEVKVEIDGGEYLDKSWGEGEIEVELPKGGPAATLPLPKADT